MPVLLGDLGSDGDHGRDAPEQTEAAFEQAGEQVPAAAGGMAVAHVLRVLLANPEQQPTALDQGEQREWQGEQVRADHPDCVDVVEASQRLRSDPAIARSADRGSAKLR